MKQVKGMALGLALAMTLAAVTACGGSQQGSRSEASSSATEAVSAVAEVTPAPAADREDASALILTDQAGREVRLESPAETIVSGYYISTSACIALGLEDKLAGIEAKAESRPIYKLAAPQMLSLPNVGTAKEFNLEGCLALDPDLVILPKRLADSANTLSDMGVPVLLVNPESRQGLMEMIALIGRAAGAEQEADRLLQYYEDKLAETAALVAQAADKPRVYMGGNSSYLTTAPGGMYQSGLMEAAGGVNAAGQLEGDSWTEVSYEQILALNPDVIVLPSEAGYSKEDVLADPQLAAVTAVANGAVYQMPTAFEAWDSPTTSCILGIRWLLNVLHEDLYSHQMLEEDVTAFYRDFYRASIDTALIGK
ncbi:ABC transporter substrate-binding protein [Ruminococcaceae bacterium OttesenSCG-928-L11]|nr:ABC transporter substrate-binding protein [Ruminococcaceae bacterium OttesenSCG-928-L11]